MNITIICRTRDEARNIGLFCKYYAWADQILIADGGSKDKTIQIASMFSNVKVRKFTERVSKTDGELWRNPHGRHINFMIDWAESTGADWIIFDDADCFPTLELIENARLHLSMTPYSFALVNRIYTYSDWAYFEMLTKPNGLEWEKNGSLYAWRANMGFRADESDPWIHAFNLPIPDRHFFFSPPMSVIHDYFPDNSRLQKVKFYDESGEQPGCQDPIHYGGDLIPLEPWMKYE